MCDAVQNYTAILRDHIQATYFPFSMLRMQVACLHNAGFEL